MKNNRKMGVLSALVVLALGSFGVSQHAWAEDYTPGDTIAVENNVFNVKYMTLGDRGTLALGLQAEATGQEALAVGVSAKAMADGAVALGVTNWAKAQDSLAIGSSNFAYDVYTAAVGYNNKTGDTKGTASNFATAMGTENTAIGRWSVALGASNKANADGMASAVGAGNTASETGAVAMGTGNTASGKYASALGGYNTAVGSNSTAAGQEVEVYGANSAAFGYKNVVGKEGAESGKDTYVFGANNTVTANNAIVLGTGVTTVADNSVVIGAGSMSEEANTVSVGSSDTRRRIVHVADGEKITDAATWGQAITENKEFAVKHQRVTVTTNNGKEAFTITGLAATDADIGDTKKLVDAGLGDSVVDSVLSVNDKVETLSDDVKKVGAGAAALAALRPETFDPMDKWSFAVGYGHYKSANAGALGAFFKPNADTTLSIGSTIGNGDPMMNAGVSFKLGQRGSKLPQNASNSQLVQEVNTLRAQNAQQQNEITALRADNQRMQQQIEQILSKLEMSGKVSHTAR